MKFVALLSGGKDSCFNIVHCTANGHELVAAASLRPPPGQGEIDSFMYQTVGQDAIELVAGALGVPLFRRIIHGSAVEQGGEYGAREGKMDKLEAGVEGDEAEDMFNLLSEVKRDQRELMSEMIQAGVEAILIKVAGIGLQERHLGKTLAQMEPTFHKLHDMYGAHICGEGGEYETLTLDCPAFKRRIRINETKTIVHSDHAFATVAYLEVTNAILEDKLGSVSLEPTIPPLLDETALQIQAALSARQNNPSPEDGPTASQTVTIEPKIHVTGPWAYISDVQGDLPPKESVEDEVVACFDTIKEFLLRHNLQPKHITNTMLLLSSMDLFPQVNKAYGQYFGTSPPSRACVAVDLPPPTRVRVACVAFSDDAANQRTGLHVQGISYWAPANIGPYSQAIVVQDQIFISGQIGLIPASITFPSPPSFATEAALAFQHADRILAALKDGPTAQLQGVIVWVAGNERLELGRLAWNAYSQERGMGDVPAITVAAKTLPKGAMIEVQVLAHSNRDSDGDDEVNKVNAKASSIRSEYFGLNAKTARDKSTFSVVVARNQGMKEALKAAAVVSAGKQTLSVQVFYTPDTDIEQLSYALDGFACTHIPIQGVLGADGTSWDTVLCLHSVPWPCAYNK
ncbi:diphthamide biosynthesis protein [Ceratobasidium sp. AG-Ba]|nr:diphthamide biosynthesis protein [Ceratobasidium sp. AG-Ba]